MKKMTVLPQKIALAGSIAMLCLLPACTTTSPAINKVEAPKKNTFFEQFDSNKDKIVTVNEFLTARQDRFSKNDLDNDGLLSRKEYLQASKARRKARKEKARLERRNQRFAETDSNQNGNISEAEYLAASQARTIKSFANMDKDNNGIVSSNEYNDYRYMGHNSTIRKYSPYQMFKDTDTNKDNQISKEEQNAARLKWFNSMDKNGNKIITLIEYRQARQEREKPQKK